MAREEFADLDPAARIGEILRRARVQAGMKQADLAEAADISTGYLSQIESGGGRRTSQIPKSPSADVWRRLVAALPELVSSIESLPPQDRPEDWPSEATAAQRPPTVMRQHPAMDDPRNRPIRSSMAGSPPPSPAGDDVIALLEGLLERFGMRRITSLLTHLLGHLGAYDPGQESERVAGILDAAAALADGSGGLHGGRYLISGAQPGDLRYVWAKELAESSEGALYINPHAASLGYLPANEGGRVMRHEDGRLLAMPAEGDNGLRTRFDPSVHTLRVIRRTVWPGAEVPYVEFARTRISMTFGVERLTVTASGEPGTVEGPWPAGVDCSVHIVTAANPAMELLTDQENAGRLGDLHDLLTATSLRWVPARSHAPDVDGAYDEDGVALLDVGRAAALALARVLGQTSIFEWTPDAWAVIAVDGPMVLRGWQASPTEP